MSAISWKMAASGDWSLPANWSPSQVPGAGDDVTIAVPGSYTVTVSAAESAHSLTFSSNAATLGVNASLAVSSAFSQSSGTVSGTGVVTMTGAASLTGGYEQGTGTTKLKGATTLGVPGAAGYAQFWEGGRTIDNAGTLTWAGNDVLFEGATLANFATVDVTGNGTFTDYSGTNAVTNASLFEKTAGGGLTTIGVRFTNTGTVSVTSGTLSLNGGGSSSGALTVGAGATLAFGGTGIFAITGGSIGGAGTLLVDSYSGYGQLQFNAASTTVSSAFSQTSGTVSGTGVVTFTSAASLTGGYEDGTGTTKFKGATTLGVPGAAGYAQFWEGGRTIDNAGTFTWAGNDVLFEGATLANFATVDVTGNGTFTDYSGTNAVTNASLFEKTAGGGLTTIGVRFTNTGTVSVTSGTLSLNGGGGSSGALTVGAGVRLAFGGTGIFAITGGSIGGAGTLLVDSYSGYGQLQFNAASTTVSSAFSQTSGTLSGTGVLTVTGAASLTGGYEQGTGTTKFKGATTLGVPGAAGYAQFWEGGRTIDNAGALTWAGNDVLFEGATLANFATVDVTGNGTFTDYSGTNAVTNASLFEKTAGGGLTTIGVRLTNTGTVSVTSGTLSLNGGGGSSGALTVGAGATLAFGGTGIFAITGGSIGGAGTLLVDSYSGYGQLQFNAASTTVSSAFSQSSGTLSGTGVVTMTGAASLTGGYEDGTGTTRFQGATILGTAGLTGYAQYWESGRTIQNAGTLTWAGNDVFFFNAAFSNFATVDVTGNGAFHAYSGTNTVTNGSLFEKTAGGGLTTIGAAFANTGTVSVTSGALSLDGGGSSSGTFTVGSGATLAFGASGVFEITGGSVGGAGRLLVDSISGYGQLQFNAAQTTVSTAFSQKSGTVSGTGVVTMTGPASLIGGYEQGIGTTKLKGATTLGTAGSTGYAQFWESGRTIQNAGTLNWAGNDVFFDGATLSNFAVVDVTGNGMFYNYSGTNSVSNASLFEKTAGGGLTSIGVGFTNTGTVSVTSGTLSLNGGGSSSGTFTVGSGATLAFGGTGTFTITGGTFTGAGSLTNDHGVLAKSGAGGANIDTAFINSATVMAGAGKLSFLHAVLGAGHVEIAAGANATFLDGAAATQTVTFQAATGELDLASPSQFLGVIAGFGGSDRIDLLGTAANGHSFAGGRLTVTEGTTQVASLAFSGNYATSNFVLTPDAHGGTVITWTA